MTSLGPHATTTRLDVVTLGSENSPVETIYRASTDFYKNDLTYIETDSDQARFRIKEDGHLQIVEGLELFHGTEDLRTATKQFSLGLTSTGQFVIRDEVNDVDRLTIGDAGLVLSVGDIIGEQAALDAKQDRLTSGGLSVSSELLTTLPLVAGSDANDHTKIPSALAVENAIESATADCITGTNGGVRTGSVTTSATNVPSCLAVNNFVSEQVPLIGDGRYLQLTSGVMASMSIGSLTISSATASNLSVANAVIDDLSVAAQFNDVLQVTSLSVANAVIDDLSVAAQFNDVLQANHLSVANAAFDDLSVAAQFNDVLTVTTLSTTNLSTSSASIGDLSVSTQYLGSIRIGSYVELTDIVDYDDDGFGEFGLHVNAGVGYQQYPMFCRDIRFGDNQYSILSLQSEVGALQTATSTTLSTATIDNAIINELSVGSVLASGVTLGVSGVISAGESLAVSGDVVYNSISGVEASLATKHPLTTVDSTPTSSSTNLVTSGGVHDYVGTRSSGIGGLMSYNAKGVGNFSIAVGLSCGYTQGGSSVAIGHNCALSDQNSFNVAIGNQAAMVQQDYDSIAIGHNAALSVQGRFSVAVGSSAAKIGQGNECVAVGADAGEITQSVRAVAVGYRAGMSTEGEDSVCVGAYAGLSVCHDRCMVLNATGVQLDTVQSDSCYISPLRNAQGTTIMQYNNSSGEVTHNNTVSDHITMDSLSVGEFYGAISASIIGGGTVSNTEFGYLDGVTSSVQTQLNDKHPLTTVSSTPTTASSELITSGGVYDTRALHKWNTDGMRSYNAKTTTGYRSIALGFNSGGAGTACVAIGLGAAEFAASSNSICVGSLAGSVSVGINCVCIGAFSGYDHMADGGIAIGPAACRISAGDNVVAIGREAGWTGMGDDALAFGSFAGRNQQGVGSVCIGNYAGYNTCHERSVVINGTGVTLDTGQSDSLYAAPIRGVSGTTLMQYNTGTNEITNSNTITDDVVMSSLSVATLIADSVQLSVSQSITSANTNAVSGKDVHTWHVGKMIYQAKLGQWLNYPAVGEPTTTSTYFLGYDLGTWTEDINVTSESILVSGYKFTVPRDGHYRVTGVFDQYSDADSNFGVHVNDVQKFFSRPGYNGEISGYLNAILALSAGDYISFSYYDGTNSYSINTNMTVISITEF